MCDVCDVCDVCVHGDDDKQTTTTNLRHNLVLLLLLLYYMIIHLHMHHISKRRCPPKIINTQPDDNLQALGVNARNLRIGHCERNSQLYGIEQLRVRERSNRICFGFDFIQIQVVFLCFKSPPECKTADAIWSWPSQLHSERQTCVT